MKDPLLLRIAEYIGQYQMLAEGNRVLAAISGGADSVFLLRALEALAPAFDATLLAVHVEHGIRGGSSRADAAFVKALCDEKQIPCRIISVDAPAFAKKEGIGLEEAARRLRYQAFEELAGEESCDKIAVAHHMDDNAETMLFHLARGTGIPGLSGIPPVRGRIIRPLLCVTRDEIGRWLFERGEDWRTDETNTDTAFSRNRIRAEILPQLKTINSGAVSHMAELAELLRRITDYFDRETEKMLCGDPFVWEIAGLESMEPVLLEHLVYRALQMAAGSTRDITREHVRSVCALCGKGVGKRVCLPYGLVAEREYGQLRIRRKTEYADGWTQEAERQAGNHPGKTAEAGGLADAFPVTELKIPGETVYGSCCTVSARMLPFDGDMEKIPQNTYTKWFDYDKISDHMQIRPRKTGDFLQIRQDGGHKRIQDYMVEEKIPSKHRSRIPLIADGSHIVWVVGWRISAAYRITPQTRQVLELTVSDVSEETLKEREHDRIR